MGEALHVAALAAAGVGTCCVAATPRARVRGAEMLASIVMVAAMLDLVAGWGLLPAVAWALALLACSLVLAVSGRTRRRTAGPPASCAADAHTALGGLAMAPLVLMMGADPAVAASTHSHGMSAVILLAPAAAYVVWSGVLVVRAGARSLVRMQHLTMGLSTLLMALAALLPHR